MYLDVVFSRVSSSNVTGTTACVPDRILSGCPYGFGRGLIVGWMKNIAFTGGFMESSK